MASSTKLILFLAFFVLLLSIAIQAAPAPEGGGGGEDAPPATEQGETEPPTNNAAEGEGGGDTEAFPTGAEAEPSPSGPDSKKKEPKESKDKEAKGEAKPNGKKEPVPVGKKIKHEIAAGEVVNAPDTKEHPHEAGEPTTGPIVHSVKDGHKEKELSRDIKAEFEHPEFLSEIFLHDLMAEAVKKMQESAGPKKEKEGKGHGGGDAASKKDEIQLANVEKVMSEVAMKMIEPVNYNAKVSSIMQGRPIFNPNLQVHINHFKVEEEIARFTHERSFFIGVNKMFKEEHKIVEGIIAGIVTQVKKKIELKLGHGERTHLENRLLAKALCFLLANFTHEHPGHSDRMKFIFVVNELYGLGLISIHSHGEGSGGGKHGGGIAGVTAEFTGAQLFGNNINGKDGRGDKKGKAKSVEGTAGHPISPKLKHGAAAAGGGGAHKGPKKE